MSDVVKNVPGVSISRDKLACGAKMLKKYQGASLLDLKYDNSKHPNLRTLELAEMQKSEKWLWLTRF